MTYMRLNDNSDNVGARNARKNISQRDSGIRDCLQIVSHSAGPHLGAGNCGPDHL